MRQIIRLTESDLRGIIKESVKRILREDDFGSFDYSADIEYQRKEAENESSVYYLYYVDTNEFIPYKVGDKVSSDNYYGISIKPVFAHEGEDGYEMEDIEYEIEEMPEEWNEEKLKQVEPMLDKIIYANYDAIYNYIKKNAPYRIY